MTITQVQVLSWPVRDQDRSREFFVDVLGFELIRDNPFGAGQRWIEVGPKGAATSLTLVTWSDQMPPGSAQGLVLETDDVDADAAALAARGVELSPIDEQPWGRYTTFTDPDGNGIVLQTSRL